MRIYDLYTAEFYRGLKLNHQFMFLALATLIASFLLIGVAVVLAYTLMLMIAVACWFKSAAGVLIVCAGILSIEIPLCIIIGKLLFTRLFMYRFFTGMKERC